MLQTSMDPILKATIYGWNPYKLHQERTEYTTFFTVLGTILFLTYTEFGQDTLW